MGFRKPVVQREGLEAGGGFVADISCKHGEPEMVRKIDEAAAEEPVVDEAAERLDESPIELDHVDR